ncbi:MAG: ABC transporter permease [Frankiaceae bacterium]
MSSTLVARVVPPVLLGGRAHRILERNLMATRRHWMIIVTGFFEPVLYLFSVGVGISKLVGTVPVAGHAVAYTTFVAPGLMAASAMNGAVYDSTFNVFFKLKFAKTYDAILSTPLSVGDVALGEIGWALGRGLLYAAAFLVTMAAMGLVASPWAVLALPASTLIGFAFAAVGIAATSYMRSWQDFDIVQLAVLPMFLFSATFYPLATYPDAVRWLVELTPLFHGVSLIRGLTTGLLSWSMLADVGYLVALGLVGLVVAGRRLERLLLT